MVVEDAAQAHGAQIEGRMAGTFGHAGCFSFYPGKNLGAYGDGGAVVTSDRELADRIRRIANHGRTTKYNHAVEGVNSRLDGIQAAILSVKLRHLEDWTRLRNENAASYTRLLGEINDVVTPTISENGRHVFHLYVIQVERRDAFLEYLHGNDIHAGIHYPIPCPLLDAYRDRGFRAEDYPVSSRVADEIVSLPMYPELTMQQIEHVVSMVRGFFD